MTVASTVHAQSLTQKPMKGMLTGPVTILPWSFVREGVPLRRGRWHVYLDWATRAFRIAASVLGDTTQIPTHRCYAQFNDILPQIAARDADVITIETSRSDRVKLLQKASTVIPPANLWLNPDCGLKTRGWAETEAALRNMLAA